MLVAVSLFRLSCLYMACAQWPASVIARAERQAVRRWTTFVGLGVLVIAAPATGIFVGIMTQQREDMLAYTDKRIVLVNQLLAGIKALKTYAWEAAQEARVRAPAWAPGACPCPLVLVRLSLCI